MRWIFLLSLFLSVNGYSQWKDYKINNNGDTLNRIDKLGRKQGPWLNHYDKLRGEPGYEEEGWYTHNRKEGEWKLYSLMGDLVGVEYYKWGFKDSVCRYYTIHGNLRLEQRWKAMNPDKEYDTLEIEDPDKLDTYRKVVVKNEGASIRHGTWRYYDAETGALIRSETYTLGKLEDPGKPAAVATTKKPNTKPQEILDFEKKNAGKKKIKFRDGSTGN